MIFDNFTLLSKIDYREFVQKGVDINSVCSAYSVNPYSDEFHHQLTPHHVSYSYVVAGDIDVQEYLTYESKFVTAFQKIYSNFKIGGIKIEPDRVYLIEYNGFLSFRKDLEDSLRENRNLYFLIDSAGLIINGGYDLTMILYKYVKEGAFFDDIIGILKEEDLYLREIEELE